MMSACLSPRGINSWGHQDIQTCDVQFIQLRGQGRVVILPSNHIHPTNDTSFEINVSIHETPRSLTFALPNGLLKDHPNIEGDGDFRYIQGQEVDYIGDKLFNMRVRGDGTLNIESFGRKEPTRFKIQLRIKCTSFVLLALPQEFNGNFDIHGDGNIQFSTHFEDEVSYTRSMEMLTSANETESKDCTDMSIKRLKRGHQRNSSDYLQITGSNESLLCDSDRPDELPSLESNDEHNGACSIEGHDEPFGTDFDHQINKESKCRKYEDCNCEVLTGMSKKEIENDFKHKKSYDDFRNSVIKSNSKPWYRGACLKCAIRYNFTLLLDKLALPELCKHLYANGIVNMKYYETLIELCKENYMDAKISLLLYLSKKSICHDDFLRSLYDSYMYELVPKFYPGVKI